MKCTYRLNYVVNNAESLGYIIFFRTKAYNINIVDKSFFFSALVSDKNYLIAMTPDDSIPCKDRGDFRILIRGIGLA